MSDPESRGPRRRLPLGPAALALLLFVYLALAIGSARQDSVTVDELGHLPAGVYFLATGDPRYAALNPPLVNALSALPVLWMDLDREIAPPPPSDDPFSFWDNGYQFQERHRSDYLRIFDAARLVPILGVAALAVLAFAWARRLAPEAGDLAGLLAAGFVCLSPNVIAHARLIGTDTGTALFVALALWGLRRMLVRPRAATALGCGALLGLALLSKLYAWLLPPVFAVAALVWHRASPAPRPHPGRVAGCLAGALATGLLVLNAGYLFREVGASLSELALESPALSRWQDTAIGALPLPLPAAFVRGLDGQLVEVGSKIPSFLFGERFEGGRWYYYLAILSVKTPLPLLLALALALAVSIPRPRLPVRDAVLLLAYPLLLFAVLSASGGRQLGGRALVSAAPLVWIAAAATLARAAVTRRYAGPIAVAALLATAVVSVRAYPHFISYFNAFAGGSERGHRLASEGNVDIGQGLRHLARHLERERAGPVQLLYFGSVDPALYGIDYRVPVGSVEPGLLAVSVSLYHLGYPMYDHGELRRVGPVEVVGLGDPVASLGGSIHVYRVGP